jgi:hypothetical protein
MKFDRTAGVIAKAASLAAMAVFTLTAEAQVPLLGLTHGCPWIPTNDAVTNNTGYPDTQATYTAAVIPVNPGNGAVIEIRGRYPNSRYFSFQAYDGFRPGNVIDTLPDSRIQTTSGLPLDPNPAVLTPARFDDANAYVVRVVFEDKPASPADRAPNTLYAGSGTNRLALAKQIVYRIYYPDPGQGDLAGVPLPDLIYIGPDGTFDLNTESPNVRACNTQAFIEERNTLFPAFGTAQGQRLLAFRPVAEANTAVFYPNADSTYLRAQPGRSYGDMVVVRSRAQRTPVLPPVVVDDPQVRYWSLCQNQLVNTAVVDCLADTQVTVQPDGYFVTVVSPPERRPALARPEFGYNWLPFGQAHAALLALRQILVEPSFKGNYQRAIDNPDLTLAQALGTWAPQITYCDSATFAAVAPSGGAAVFDACKLAADRRTLFNR